MGTQTGVSLYAPSTGASLVSLRGTDGISSGAGVMPLTWLQDFEGPIARTTSDIARILNVTTGTDPDDLATVDADADAKRPADWKTSLDRTRCRARRSATSRRVRRAARVRQEDGTIDALKARFADIVAAGATLVPITAAAPSPPVDRHAHRQPTQEGWQRYFDLHAEPAVPRRRAISCQLAEDPPVQPRNTSPAAAPDREQDIASSSPPAPSTGALRAWMDTQASTPSSSRAQLSDIYHNDAIQPLRPTATAASPTSTGVPTLIFPVGRQRPRRADRPAVRRQGVRRREAARLRLRVRAHSADGPPGAGDGAAAAVRDRGDRPRSAARSRRRWR